MYYIRIFDFAMRQVGVFRCPEYRDAILTFKEFVQCGYSASLYDPSDNELCTQYVYH